MKVTITRPARSDIRQIFDYLEDRAGRRKAREIVAELRERCAGLQRIPLNRPLRPFGAPGRRRVERRTINRFPIR